MTDKNTLMEFPCDFQIKIIGNKTKTFVEEITHIARKHFPSIDESLVRMKLSEKGNYLALTITVHALNQEMLDDLYKELTKHPDIKMVL